MNRLLQGAIALFGFGNSNMAVAYAAEAERERQRALLQQVAVTHRAITVQGWEVEAQVEARQVEPAKAIDMDYRSG